MPQLTTADRVKIVPADKEKAEAKAQLEKDDKPGDGHRDISSIHPKHWDAMIATHKDEKELLEKLGAEDTRKEVDKK